MRIRRFLLGKWRGSVTTAPIALTVIYNGSNQILVSAGQGTGNMLYKLNNGSWSYDRPQAQNVNTYTVYYKAEENKKYKESEIGSVTAAIAKVIPTVTAPTPETLTYNTQAQSLISAGSTNWGTLKYSLDNKIFSTNIPTATDAGNYKVYYRVDGDSNIEDVAAAYVDVTISPKVVSSPTITLGTNSYVYNGQEKKPTVSSVKDGNVTIASTEYTVSYTDNINAGTATCVITDKEGGNYTVSGTKTYTINKADTTYTAPIAKTLTYTGESQELLSAGTVSGGVIKYSSDNSTWGDTIPSQTTAGTYTSYWKIIGDSNHNDKASASIETTIAKKALNASVSITGWNYGDTANSPSVSGNDGNGTVTYNYKLSSAADSTYSATVPTNAGNYTVRAVIDTTTNYLGTTVTTTFTIAKVDVTYTAPTIKQNLVYNGSAQDLLNAGTVTGGTMKYSKDEVTWSTSIPQSTNAALYTSYWRIDGDSNHNDYSGGMLSTRISKATGAATISSVTSDYTGSAQDMISVSGNTGTMHYRVGTDGTWQDTKPTRTLVGSDTIYYYMDTSANYFAQGSESEPWGSVTSTINKATRSGFAVSMANWTYGTTASDPSVSNNYENGTVTYSYKVNGAADNTYTSTKPSDVGTYVIKAVATETDNYKESTATTTFSIIKLDPSYTAPTAKSLTYSGSAQSLLNAGSTNDGTIQYSSDGSTWSTTIPTATNAGSHNTYWRLVGDAQHKDIASTKIVVTIGKKSISPSVSMSGWTYGGTASSPSVSGNDGSGTVTYKYKVSGAADSTYTTTKPSNAGTYVVWASIAETSNYQSGSATNTFTISKANISPSVSMGGWTYGGTASSPSVSGNTGGGGVTYSYKTSGASDSTYSSTKPSNAGTYTVRASIDSTTNYNSATCTTNFTISKANPTYSAPTAKSGLSYSGSSQTLYNAGSNTTAGSFSYTNGTRTNAGTQTVSWSFTPTDTTNYNSKSGSFDVTIAKANPSYTAPTATSPTYNGSGQSLLNAGSSSDGTIQYSSDNSSWSTSIPTGTNAGSYTSYWRVVGDSNHNDASSSVSTTISKATGSASLSVPTLTYNGSAQDLVSLNSSTGTMYYSLDTSNWSTTIPYGAGAGLYKIYWVCQASTNYTEVSGWTTNYIQKATPTIQFNYYYCKTFDAIPIGQTVRLNVNCSNDDATITYSSTSSSVSISGYNATGVSENYECYISATASETANYKSVTIAHTFQVVPTIQGIPVIYIGGIHWMLSDCEASTTTMGNWYKWAQATSSSSTYLDSNGSPTKYTNSDGKTVLEYIDDAVYKETSGIARIPTKVEWENLLSSTTFGSMDGYPYLLDNNSSKHIFFNIGGHRLPNGQWLRVYPEYWTSTVGSNKEMAFAANPKLNSVAEIQRSWALCIRGVVP